MKHLRGSLVTKPLEVEENTDTVRYIDGQFGRFKQFQSNIKCCMCEQYMWLEDMGGHIMLREGFKVGDPRAYVGGLPDYLISPHLLLECHYGDCRVALQTALHEGRYPGCSSPTVF